MAERSKTATLRRLLKSRELEFLMEAHNGLSARIVEEAGFKGIWASGLGQTVPPYTPGRVITPPYGTVRGVTVKLGDQDCTVDFAGPTFAGVYQINIHVPQLPPGDARLVLSVNGVTSQPAALLLIGQ